MLRCCAIFLSESKRQMAKPVVLPNGKSWPSIKACKTHFSAMLHRHRAGQRVECQQDHEDLKGLLERYDVCRVDRRPKIGVGIDYFSVERNVSEGYSTLGFWAHRVDGTITDFSYIKAVEGRPKSGNELFNEACREAVNPHIATLKKAYFSIYSDGEDRVECDVTGKRLTFKAAHVDHAFPVFRDIVKAFRKTKGWGDTFPPEILTPHCDMQVVTTFADAKVQEEFCDFHHALAILRVVDKHYNLSSSKEQRDKLCLEIKRPLSIPNSLI